MAIRVLTLIALFFAVLNLPVYSARLFDRRTDLGEAAAAAPVGWTVPLEGGQVCDGDSCFNSLSAPASNKTLANVFLGRGTFNYTCEGAQPANAPVFVEQYTTLYSASQLSASTLDENLFHLLVQQLYEYDYSDLKNSSTVCAGTVSTLNGLAYVDLTETATFKATLLETIPSPDDPDFNGLWSHARSLNNEWEMYRVEMVGGAIPATCRDITGSWDVEYAAEYWFYRA